MKKIVIISIVLFTACKTNLDEKLEEDTEKLKTEYKVQTEKFVKENSSKLTDEQMLKSLDSITEEFIVTKNKQLVIKYIESESGVKRLNFLKNKFTKAEINSLLKKIPESIKDDTNYISLKQYAEH